MSKLLGSRELVTHTENRQAGDPWGRDTLAVTSSWLLVARGSEGTTG